MLCRGERAKGWVWRGVKGKRRGEEAASDGFGRVRNGVVGSRWEVAMAEVTDGTGFEEHKTDPLCIFFFFFCSSKEAECRAQRHQTNQEDIIINAKMIFWSHKYNLIPPKTIKLN